MPYPGIGSLVNIVSEGPREFTFSRSPLVSRPLARPVKLLGEVIAKDLIDRDLELMIVMIVVLWFGMDQGCFNPDFM